MKTSGLIVAGLGAASLGTLAYLALKKTPAPASPRPAVLPDAPSFPGLPGLPDLPGALTPEAALVFVQSLTSLHLRQGQYYRGRMLLQPFGLPPFNTGSTEEDIARGLVALGFRDVRVFMNVSDLPMAASAPGGPWPASTAQNTAAGTRWFQGQWSGLTMDLPKPVGVEKVWVTASPDLVASRQAQATRTSGMTG